MDKYLLSKMHDFSADVTASYEAYEFDKGLQNEQMNLPPMKKYPHLVFLVYKSLLSLCSTELSSFYFDAIKDRLYNDEANSLSRRSAQTVLYHVGVSTSIQSASTHLRHD
jgi:isoleucyl-tRNA synthetase